MSSTTRSRSAKEPDSESVQSRSRRAHAADQDPEGLQASIPAPSTSGRHDPAVPREQVRPGPRLSQCAHVGWQSRGSIAGWRPISAPTTPSSTAHFGRIALIAAVRRVRHPGCKFDPIIVLEGPMGTNKSKTIETLAGVENFSDQIDLRRAGPGAAGAAGRRLALRDRRASQHPQDRGRAHQGVRLAHP